MKQKLWLRMALVALIIGLIAGGLVFFLGRPIHPAAQYTSQVMLLVPPPGRYTWNFTEELETKPDTRRDLRYTVSMLAQSRGILNKVIATMGEQLPEDRRDPLLLRQWLKANASQAVFVKLVARAETPELTTTLLQTWTDIVTQEANDLFYYPISDLPAMQRAADAAYQRLQEKESKLQAYQAQTGLDLIVAAPMGATGGNQQESQPPINSATAPAIQLKIINQQLAANHHALQVLIALQESVSDAQAKGLSANAIPLELIDGLTGIPEGSVPNKEKLLNMGSLPAIANALAKAQNHIAARTAILEGEASSLQKQLSSEIFTLRQLIRERDIAENSYNVLQNKLTEMQAVKAAQLPVHVDNGPTIPEPVAAPRPRYAMIIAALLIAFILAFLAQWVWYERSRQTDR